MNASTTTRNGRTTTRYLGADGQVHARFTCQRTDCATWDGSPIEHGDCRTCGGRTHAAILTYSFGSPVVGCSSCASSLNFTTEASK